jgi:GT2 family glycosyltransferase
LDAIPSKADTNAPPVYILILNWNGVADTLECLESVFRSDYPSFRVIVCDNSSEDGSVEQIEAWAEGKIDVALPDGKPLSRYPCMPLAKPIPLVIHDRCGAEKGGGPADTDARLVIIRNGDNLGYAAGNNVGLRYIRARDDFAFVWLLNNDTVVTPGALSALVRRMVERPEAGLCGSTLFYYDLPEKVQALGGFTYNTWFARSRPIGHERSITLPLTSLEINRIESRMFGIQGAAVFVSCAFLRDVGLTGKA